MAEVRPFRGVRYNEHMISDLSAVICPPYDIITPEMALELYWRSEYNFVRMEYGPQTGRDESPDSYARSAAMLESWLDKGILKTDEKPAIYLHDHLFAYQGKTHRRRGITVAVRLEEWEKRVIRPHESTLAKPKSDRLNLLFALKANTSPILALFEDGRGGIGPLLASEAARPPVIHVESAGEGSHLVWAITDPGATREIAAKFADKPLYIADGHHRYESALNHQRQRRACSASVSGEEGYNFVMMTLVAFNDPGLMVLSPHRLVRNISHACLEELIGKLATLFDIEELPLATPGLWEQVSGFLSCGQINETRLVLFGLSREKLLLLKLRYPNAARQMMPYFHGELYTRLGVSVLDHVILEKMLGVGQGSEGASLDFCYHKQDAVKRVLDGEFQLAFLLCPVKTDMIKAMADAGERMPRKSTYFYPKLPTGLVFRRLDTA